MKGNTPSVLSNQASVRQWVERLWKSEYLNPEASNKSLLERLPQPTGWRILVMPYQGKGKHLVVFTFQMK